MKKNVKIAIGVLGVVGVTAIVAGVVKVIRSKVNKLPEDFNGEDFIFGYTKMTEELPVLMLNAINAEAKELYSDLGFLDYKKFDAKSGTAHFEAVDFNSDVTISYDGDGIKWEQVDVDD